MTPDDKALETEARHLCYASCSKGEFLDFEHGCVSVCQSPDACQGWRALVTEARLMGEKRKEIMTDEADDVRDKAEPPADLVEIVAKELCCGGNPCQFPKNCPAPEAHEYKSKRLIAALADRLLPEGHVAVPVADPEAIYDKSARRWLLTDNGWEVREDEG